MDLILSALALAGILVLGLAVFYAVSVYNGLVQARQNVAKAWGDVDVLLRQRHDELPSLVQVCKGAALHEAAPAEDPGASVNGPAQELHDSAEQPGFRRAHSGRRSAN